MVGFGLLTVLKNIEYTGNAKFNGLRTVFRKHQNGVFCVFKVFLKTVLKNGFQKQEPNRPVVF